jgi:hypothetical protein
MAADGGAGAAAIAEKNEAAAAKIATLTLEASAPGGVERGTLYPVEGGLLVLSGKRVGRIVGSSVEWSKGKIPEDSEALGAVLIGDIRGRWPDALDMTSQYANGRDPMPTYAPLTGKAQSVAFRSLGLVGMAKVGASTVVAGETIEGDKLVTVRGPKLPHKPMSSAEAGCKPSEGFGTDPIAVPARAIEATPAGTLVSVGRLCGARGPAAEVWDKAGKPRIVDLSPWWKSIDWRVKLLQGSGDELWLFAGPWRPLLRFHDGKVEPVPRLERLVRNLFASPAGQLYASDTHTIHRYENGAWVPFGRLPSPREFGSFGFEGETMWAGDSRGLYRLRPGPATEAPETCSTPFVYLYDVSPKNAEDFTFPATQKALSTFAGVSDLGLVEFKDDDTRRLGIQVPSKAQGEAVIAHIKSTMKDEDPQLYCYEPKAPRKIEIKPAGK